MDARTRRRASLVVLAIALFACSVSGAATQSTFKCRVPRVVVTTESRAGALGLSKGEVAEIVGKNPNFVDPHVTHWTCTDGTSSSASGGGFLSTPGGDAGEFLMGLSLYAAEMVQYYPDYQLSQHEVDEMFIDYMTTIDASRAFYMHMDQNVYDALQAKLVSVVGPGVNMTRIALAQQTQVLPYVTDPDYVGCSHLRAIMQFPGKYGISRNTTTLFLSTFYLYMWNHPDSAKIAFSVTDAVPIDGSRHERAYLKLGTDQSALDRAESCLDMAPVLPTDTSLGSIFLAQPQFVGSVRDSIVFYFSRKLQSLVGEQESTAINIEPQMAALAATHLQLSVQNLALGKIPVYTVTLVLDNSASVLRLLIAAIFSILLLVILFASITYVKYRQILRELAGEHLV